MKRSTKSTVTLAGIALASFLVSYTALTAQGGGQAPPPAANTPPKPLVPVAASSVAANPDQYVGEYVTMTGAVEALLTKTSFSVDHPQNLPWNPKSSKKWSIPTFFLFQDDKN